MAITPAIKKTMPLTSALKPLTRERVKMPTKGLLKTAINPKIIRITPPMTAKIHPAYAKEFKLIHLQKSSRITY